MNVGETFTWAGVLDRMKRGKVSRAPLFITEGKSVLERKEVFPCSLQLNC